MADSDLLIMAGAAAGIVLLWVGVWAAKAASRSAAQSRLRQQMSQQTQFEAAAFADRVRMDHDQAKASASKLMACIRELGSLTGQPGGLKQVQLQCGVAERLKAAQELANRAVGPMQPDLLASASAELRAIRSTLERQRAQIQTQCARIKSKDARPSSGAVVSTQ